EAALSPDASYAFLPGGKALLAAGRGRLRFLDPETGQEQRPSVETPDDYAFAGPVRLSPDGKLLARANGSAVRGRELATGRALGPAAEAPAGRVAVAFSPDGKALVTSDTQALHLWEAETGRHRVRLKLAEPGTSGWWALGGRLLYPSGGKVYAFL